jgi:hypothetical protein
MKQNEPMQECNNNLPYGFTSEGALVGLTSIQVEIILPHLAFSSVVDFKYQKAKSVIEEAFSNHHKYVVEDKWNGRSVKSTKFVIVTQKRKLIEVHEVLGKIQGIMEQEVIYAVYRDVAKLSNF